ncbi:MAG: ankyrin repeat domain-containing protein [Spirochaetota bacterium]
MKSIFKLFGNEADPELKKLQLHNLCMESGNLPDIEKLVEQGFSLENTDAKGRTPLFIALEYGQFEYFAYLLEKGANPNVQDEDGVTCLNIGKSSSGYAEFIELLLQHGADPNLKDKHGKTYLM